jgi:hypothetical protein
MGAAWCINLAVAEWLIRRRRQKNATSAGGGLSPVPAVLASDS